MANFRADVCPKVRIKNATTSKGMFKSPDKDSVLWKCGRPPILPFLIEVFGKQFFAYKISSVLIWIDKGKKTTAQMLIKE